MKELERDFWEFRELIEKKLKFQTSPLPNFKRIDTLIYKTTFSQANNSASAVFAGSSPASIPFLIWQNLRNHYEFWKILWNYYGLNQSIMKIRLSGKILNIPFYGILSQTKHFMICKVTVGPFVGPMWIKSNWGGGFNASNLQHWTAQKSSNWWILSRFLAWTSFLLESSNTKPVSTKYILEYTKLLALRWLSSWNQSQDPLE